MPHLFLTDLRLHYTDEGDPGRARRSSSPMRLAPTCGCGTPCCRCLPPGLRLIRLDMRGPWRGRTCPTPPYAMGALIRDAERALDALSVRDAVFVGPVHRRADRAGAGGEAAGPDPGAGAVEHGGKDRHALGLGRTASPPCARAGWHAVSEATLARWFPRPFRDGAGGGRLARAAGSDAGRRLDRRGRRPSRGRISTRRPPP